MNNFKYGVDNEKTRYFEKKDTVIDPQIINQEKFGTLLSKL